MADVTISYKNNEIATMNATGVKTLLTGDTFCEDDIVVAYTKPATPAPTLQGKTVYPSASDQTTTPDQGYDGLSSVTSKGVLLTNLTADNIKKDVVVKVGDSADDDRIISITGTYEGSGGGSGPDLPDPSTITDLSNTTWLLNESVDVLGFPSQQQDVLVQTAAPDTDQTPGRQTLGGYDVVVPVNFMFTKPARYSGATKNIQVWPAWYVIDYNVWFGFYGTMGCVFYNQYTGVTTYKIGSSGPTNPGLRVWTFLGAYPNGLSQTLADNTNANLIAWMKANATLINKS